MDNDPLQTLYLTFKLAFITTFMLFSIGVFLAYLLSFVKFPFKGLMQTFIVLPLVLPPSVLGFYLLISFLQNSFLGRFLKEYFNLFLVFNFKGLVSASLIFSLPSMVNPLQSTFSSISQNLLDASYTLGKGKIYTLFRVILPNSKVGIFSACAMSFAHTIDEFGVAMMIGGHKKGETLVASIIIYGELEVLNYTLTHQYAFTLFAISFTILLSLYFVGKRIAPQATFTIKIDIKPPINTAKGKKQLELDTCLKANEIIAIFGENGAGKTTLLKIIAGLIKPEFGRIEVGDELWSDTQKNVNLAIRKRKIGLVFQDYALFPNISVEENISYAVTSKQKAEELLSLMNLENLAKIYPRNLSGGQAQRVALVRALAREPQILLLDEPLSALNFKIRSFLQDELMKILQHFKIATLLVSHDLTEIYKLSHRVLEFKNGKTIKGSPEDEFFTHSNISTKLRLSATLPEIKKSDTLVVLTLLLNQDIIRITFSKEELLKAYQDVKTGDAFLLSIKAFNPIIVGKLDK